MKRKLSMIFTVVTLCSLVFTPSCTVKDPTFGNLTVAVYNPATGLYIANEQVYLATSLADLQNGIYIKTGWTDFNGLIYFGELAPGYYYYDTYDWEDYGGSMVYAGSDYYVTLSVNTPRPLKK